MKAIIAPRYGSPHVLQLREIEKPVPKDDEVLIRIHAASVNAYDWHLLTADIVLVRFMGGGVFKPRFDRVGADVAGRIESVGRNVRRLRPNDEVYGMIRGSFAEYGCAREEFLSLIPPGVSFVQAAAVPMAGTTALQGLRDIGHVQKGQSVLIQGASGGVGTFAVQIAKLFGAEVTAVCSPRNMAQARELGADHLIDYTTEDFTRGKQRYDVIFAANGYHPISAYKRVLTPKGIYVMAGGSSSQIFQAMLLGRMMSEKGGRTIGGIFAKRNQSDLDYLGRMLEERRIIPVIDKQYPLREAADALRYLGTGHARGKIIITVEGDIEDGGQSRQQAPSRISLS